MPARRFPPPWSIEELEACFVVPDHSGQALAYVYFEDEPRGADRQPNCLPNAHSDNAFIYADTGV